MKLTLGESPSSGTGAGVRVAVIDSGINTDNPHVTGVAGGVGIDDDGALHDDFVDCLGHGTAVAAAIQEKAPGVELYVVRVFEATLSTRAANLVAAIDLAIAAGARLANLSLGTPVASHADALREAVDRASGAGVLVVSAASHRGAPWWPGSLPQAIGVVADPACGRHELIVEPGSDEPERWVVRASPLPRPIPGVPPERNLQGISFAVANASGLLALALSRRPAAATAVGLRRLLGLPRVG